MTKYDFRIRRQLFKRSGTERFQNFEALEKRYRMRRRSNMIVRIVMVLIALVMLISLIVFLSGAKQKKPYDPINIDKIEIKLETPKKKL
jgi:hypothetical protein